MISSYSWDQGNQFWSAIGSGVDYHLFVLPAMYYDVKMGRELVGGRFEGKS